MAKFLTNIDLMKNQLKNAVIQNLTAAPANAKAGQVYFNTTTAKFCVCVNADEQKWESFPSLEALASEVQTLEGKINEKAEQSFVESEIARLESLEHLPSQADNAGKVLTTDGTDASWDFVIKMNNKTEGTETGLSKLVINKLTKEEYDALESRGEIKDTELYITDAEAYTKEEVDEKLDLKADKTSVEQSLASKADTKTVNESLDTKADKETTYTKEEVNGLVAGIQTQIDDTITPAIQDLEDTKADKETTYTKTEVNGLVDGVQGQINTINTTIAETITPAIEGLQTNKADKTEIERIEGIINGLDLDCLPEQANNAGKFLTTNGTEASWGALPEATAVLKGIVKLASADEVTAGTSTSSVVTVAQMTEKLNAVSGGASGAITTLEQKVDQHIKDTTDALDTKADKSTLTSEIQRVDAAIATKAEQSALESAVSTINQALDTKATNSDLTNAVSTLEGKINEKADQTALTNAVSTLESEINKKANAADVYTKDDIDLALNEYATKGDSLAHYGITDAYTKDEVNGLVASTFHYKGTKTTYADLPTTDLVIGDVWNIEEADTEHNVKAGDNVCWNGTSWDVLAGMTDLSAYSTSAEIANVYLTKKAATDTYLTQDAAAGTYLTQDVASNTYLAQTVAADTYATKEELSTVQSGSVHKMSVQNDILDPKEGVVEWTISHTMGEDVEVVVKEASTNEVVYTDVVLKNNEVVIKINSDEQIKAGTYKAIIMG
jgi:hypothetical protein